MFEPSDLFYMTARPFFIDVLFGLCDTCSLPKTMNQTKELTVDWDSHRQTILRLYIDENKPLHAVRKHMKEKHGFDARYEISLPCISLESS